ncbi:MAG: hypothetical protein PF961_08995 [Planctomycetota bacterium]|nr:hypothetical protein [Planctomycetota bacterium]
MGLSKNDVVGSAIAGVSKWASGVFLNRAQLGLAFEVLGGVACNGAVKEAQVVGYGRCDSLVSRGREDDAVSFFFALT